MSNDFLKVGEGVVVVEGVKIRIQPPVNSIQALCSSTYSQISGSSKIKGKLNLKNVTPSLVSLLFLRSRTH